MVCGYRAYVAGNYYLQVELSPVDPGLFEAVNVPDPLDPVVWTVNKPSPYMVTYTSDDIRAQFNLTSAVNTSVQGVAANPFAR